VKEFCLPSSTKSQKSTSRQRIEQAAKHLFARHGYDSTSTAAIARLARTSESQLLKHFGSKQGVLEAILQDAWSGINPALRLATESVASVQEKFRILVDMMLTFLGKDPEMRTLLLFEGRRIRHEGESVVLVPGFLEFVSIVDGILEQLAQDGDLTVSVQALRSALMGAIEGMLRDRMLAQSAGYPASFSDWDMRTIVFQLLSASTRHGL
jgi:AcrR family transcriptional regulator